jgi:hypothetical protein
MENRKDCGLPSLAAVEDEVWSEGMDYMRRLLQERLQGYADGFAASFPPRGSSSGSSVSGLFSDPHGSGVDPDAQRRGS